DVVEDSQDAGSGAGEAPVVLQEQRHPAPARVVAGDLERLGGPGVAVRLGISFQRRLDPPGPPELSQNRPPGPTPPATPRPPAPQTRAPAPTRASPHRPPTVTACRSPAAASRHRAARSYGAPRPPRWRSRSETRTV